MRVAKVALAALALVFAMIGTATAQGVAGKIALTPQVGLVVPTGDFSSTDENEDSEGLTAGLATVGFALGGSADYFFTDNFAAGASFIYDRFGLDTDEFVEEDETVDVSGNWTITRFGGHVKYLLMPDSPTSAVARAGVFFGKPKATISGSEGGITVEMDIDVDMALGLELGVGVTHTFSENMAFFGEVGFAHLMTDGKNVELPAGTITLNTDSEINLQWFGVKGGLTFFVGGQ